MQVVTLSLFRFTGAANKLWAFSQMQFARAALAAMPDVQWVKQFGTGSRQSFHPYPNFAVYGIMCAWPDLETARARVRGTAVFQAHRECADEAWTVFATPTSASGLWDKRQPFKVAKGERMPKPIGVLTRATVKTRHLVDFWRNVPNVADAIDGFDGVLFRQGMGEVPWVHQVTFSIWSDMGKMSAFAYAKGHHATALKRAHELGWFKEEMFARFRLIESEGTWEGRNPLDGIELTDHRPARHRSPALGPSGTV